MPRKWLGQLFVSSALSVAFVIFGASWPSVAANAGVPRSLAGRTSTSLLSASGQALKARLAAASGGPVVRGVKPGYGPQSGGTFSDVTTNSVNPQGTVTISGRGLTGATSVLFDMNAGAVAVPVGSGQVNSAGTKITGIVPPADASAEGIRVQVVTPAGTTAAGCLVIQLRCGDSFFYLSVSSTGSHSLSLANLNNYHASISSTSGPDGAKGGIINECGYRTQPSPGPSATASIAFGSTTGATLTGTSNMDTATNAHILSAFLGNVTVKLNKSVTLTISLTGSYGDCIDINTPLNFFNVLGLHIILEPSLSVSGSYTMTMAAGTYTIGEAGWVNGGLRSPVIRLKCPGTSACLKGSSPSLNGQASLIAGAMLRLGPSGWGGSAYVEAGPAMGLAAGIGSGGSFAEACAGGIWDGHLELSALQIAIGAGGPLVGPYQLAAAGSGAAAQCPLGEAVDPVTTITGSGIVHPQDITAGPDGALWFTNYSNTQPSIGRITTAGVVTSPAYPANWDPTAITAGPDGALWFATGPGGSIGRMTTAGVVTGYYTDPSIAYPLGITTGPDGNIWFTNFGNGSIGEINIASGTVSNYKETQFGSPLGITAGPDGNLWFTDASGFIGRITPAGQITTFTGPGIKYPTSITAGPDGNLWFTNEGNNSIGEITTSGVVTNYIGPGIDRSYGITVGPDGALWFTNSGNNTIGRISTAGVVTNYTGPGTSKPYQITVGSDGALWFTNAGNNSIGRITVPVQPATTGMWSNATQLVGGNEISSVSCASAGNCGAGGLYLDSSGNSQPFVASAVNGNWGNAQTIPGFASLSPDYGGSIKSLSCSSAGDCSAGGSYWDSAGKLQAFVYGQVNGVWEQQADEVPGLGSLNQGGVAELNSISCAGGDCSAGGYYTDSAGSYQAFVMTATINTSQNSTTWNNAQPVPNLSSLNLGGKAAITAVSCAAAGECTAGGYYTDASGGVFGFVVSESNGTWRNAQRVPGSTKLTDGEEEVTAVSCSSPGNCGVGGYYYDKISNSPQAFVVDQVNGGWDNAREIGSSAWLTTISCPSDGNCSAGGYYGNVAGQQAFVVDEINGNWGTAIEVPNTSNLNAADYAQVTSVSCASAGNCSAGGTYEDSSYDYQGFVVSEVGGNWKQAEEVPGTPGLNLGNAQINSVSCAAPGSCATGGYYSDASLSHQALIVDEQPTGSVSTHKPEQVVGR